MVDQKKQLTLPLIARTHANTLISQRAKDGYINATAMCKAANKRFHDYSRIGTADAFAKELAIATGIPVSELIQSVSGGIPELQGTWVHPQVAIHLAQWLSPQFAVQVTQWVFKCADYCAWAVQRKWERADLLSHTLIAPKIRSEIRSISIWTGPVLLKKTRPASLG